MSDTTVDTNVDTDQTTTDTDQTKETPAVDPIVAGEKEGAEEAETKGDDDTKEGEEEAAEFVDYDFDKDVTLKEGVTLSDDSKSIINELGKKYNLPKEAAQEIVDGFLKATDANTAAIEAAQDAHDKQTQAEWKEEIAKEQGDNLPKFKALISKAYEIIPKDIGIREFLEESGTNENPAMARLYAWIGKNLSEDTLHKVETPVGDTGTYSKYSDVLPQDNVHNTTNTTS
jgi:hypothetical protein